MRTLLAIIGAIMLSPACLVAQDRAGQLYDLYNSTSTPTSYKRVLKHAIDRQERAGQMRNKTRRPSQKLALAVSAQSGVAGMAVPLSGANTEFRLGEVYCYPNPAKRTNPTFHIETGMADKVELKIYDVSGEMVHETVLAAPPQLIDDGQGPQYAYEYLWDITSVGSGIYIFSMTAKRGDKTLKKTGRCAVIK